jgi:hypothetical protein
MVLTRVRLSTFTELLQTIGNLLIEWSSLFNLLIEWSSLRDYSSRNKRI